MTDFNEHNQGQSAFDKYDKKLRRKSRAKSFMSTVTAGVIGSVLTLTISSNFDYFKVSEQEVGTKTEQTQTQASTEAATTVQPTPVTATDSSLADIVEKSSKAIVGVVNIQEQGNYFSNDLQAVESGTGSGVIFKKDDENAYIVTNNHVIEGAKEIEVSLYSGEKTKAQLVGADALTDLAVLKIDSTLAPDVIEFGDSSTLRPGEQVLAIGNPLGLDLSRTVTQGIVSAVERSISVSTSAGKWDLNVIQTDAAINPGNSGGALINTSGQVVGINSLKISDGGVEGLGFAIPSNDLLPIVNEMIETGQVERPYLGVGLASLEEIPQMYLRNLPEELEAGIMVTNVDPNSAAGKAGMKAQDVIVAINGEEVKTSGELRKFLYSKLEIGDKVELDVYRQGERMTIELTLTTKTNI